MAWYKIPLDPEDEQRFDITLDIAGESVDLNLHLRYNSEGDFWSMDIAQASDGTMLISNMPLLTGEYPAADILGQFQHLGLGSSVVIKTTDETVLDYPNLESLGTDFVLMWGSGDPYE